MRTVLLAACLLFSPTFALAADSIDPARIVSAATGDWNKDDASDLALLVSPAEGSDEENAVYLYLTNDVGRLVLKSRAPNKVWGQFDLYGQAPFVNALPNGSIQITSHNDTIGRHRWEQTLTIAYRSSDFVVAGYTYSSYDTLDLENTVQCDFNVLSGKGTANAKPIRAKGATVLLKDWSDAIGQKACGTE
ncbi:hypothetical protein [Sinorhizobium fredii]|uniref:Uncharacterized protein n=2 Tax=Rhizobium fredii TaxID=380 RepID=A0A2A6LZ34_RHIFR|nr:hypothetical protein [Sinorhizobium fredii]AWI56711.1 hypothetical protein AB395_00001038 [Sinorhizobium fredii CCBAU 45436]AWM24511.1 hypothetical protein AOX55_00001239 [Sinorhizobium fredii CCBAU 25509]KSV90402.1 hypothetical protein N181_12445 [Sinorhizobium fredii USDA 205]MCG5474508.1 hypothetical protein [Sinorhizobium fredii]MQW97602.1 hypothetical protein [Sinorhizobium fredii]